MNLKSDATFRKIWRVLAQTGATKEIVPLMFREEGSPAAQLVTSAYSERPLVHTHIDPPLRRKCRRLVKVYIHATNEGPNVISCQVCVGWRQITEDARAATCLVRP